MSWGDRSSTPGWGYNSASTRNWGSQYLQGPQSVPEQYSAWQFVKPAGTSQYTIKPTSGGNDMWKSGMNAINNVPLAGTPNLGSLPSPYSGTSSLPSTQGQAMDLLSMLSSQFGGQQYTQAAPNLQTPSVNYQQLPDYTAQMSAWQPPTLPQYGGGADLSMPQGYGSPQYQDPLAGFNELSQLDVTGGGVNFQQLPTSSIQSGAALYAPTLQGGNLSFGDIPQTDFSAQVNMPALGQYRPELTASSLPNYQSGGPALQAPTLPQAMSVQDLAGIQSNFPTMDYGFSQQSLLGGGAGGGMGGGMRQDPISALISTGINRPTTPQIQPQPPMPDSGYYGVMDDAFTANWKPKTSQAYANYLRTAYELESDMNRKYDQLQSTVGLGYAKQAQELANMLANYQTGNQSLGTSFLAGLI